MEENINYEKVVTAEIINNPKFELPEVTPDELIAGLRRNVWKINLK